MERKRDAKGGEAEGGALGRPEDASRERELCVGTGTREKAEEGAACGLTGPGGKVASRGDATQSPWGAQAGTSVLSAADSARR